MMSTVLLMVSLTSLASLNVANAATVSVGDTVEPKVAVSASTSADKTVSVTCPNGTKVVGAGGSVTGERTTITRVRPSANLSSVEVEAVEHGAGTPQSWTVTVRANCAPGSFTLATKTGTKTAEATCPAGKKSLGVMGEVVDWISGVHLTRLVPKSDLKGGLVEASGPGDAWGVTAYAICGSGQSGLVLRSASSHVLQTQTGAKSVPCQEDEHTVSAGGAVVAGAVIDDVVPMGSGALVTGETKDSQAIRWSITTYAVCSQ